MKKCLAILIALVLMMGICATAEVVKIPEYGMEIELPDNRNEKNLTIMSIEEGDIVGISIVFINNEEMAKAKEAYDQAAETGDQNLIAAAMEVYNEAYMANVSELYYIVGIPTQDAEENGYGDTVKFVGENSTHSYYCIPLDVNTELSEESAAKLEEAKPLAEQAVASVKISEITKREVSDSALAQFSSIDMNGDKVDASIFAGADLTILNIWGTYCNPCISEMPELAAWSKELPENVQLVGLIVDVASPSDKTYAKAQKILDKSGAKFTNILMDASLAPLTSGIVGTPTTLFIDKNGNQVHEGIPGANVGAYKQAVEEILAK